MLLDQHSLALLLAPGAHTIAPNLEVEDGKCGLIPLGGACEHVTTQVPPPPPPPPPPSPTHAHSPAHALGASLHARLGVAGARVEPRRRRARFRLGRELVQPDRRAHCARSTCLSGPVELPGGPRRPTVARSDPQWRGSVAAPGAPVAPVAPAVPRPCAVACPWACGRPGGLPAGLLARLVCLVLEPCAVSTPC